MSYSTVCTVYSIVIRKSIAFSKSSDNVLGFVYAFDEVAPGGPGAAPNYKLLIIRFKPYSVIIVVIHRTECKSFYVYSAAGYGDTMPPVTFHIIAYGIRDSPSSV